MVVPTKMGRQLPKADVADKFTHYIIIFIGEKFYIIELAYFLMPPEVLKKLLNDPMIIIATSNWETTYHAVQLLSGTQPNGPTLGAHWSFKVLFLENAEPLLTLHIIIWIVFLD